VRLQPEKAGVISPPSKGGSGAASTHPFLVLEQWPRRLPHIRHRPAS